MLAFVVVLALAAKNLVRGRIGRMWMAMRDMDIAAEIIGIRPLHAKLTAFAVSSFYIGIAGALWGFLRLGSWEPLAFDVNRSFQVLFMVIIGGLGTILGSFLGAAFIVLIADLAQPAAALARHSDVDRDDFAHRIHVVRRHDRFLPDRRAAWPCPACGRSARKSCGCGRSRIEQRTDQAHYSWPGAGQDPHLDMTRKDRRRPVQRQGGQQ